PPQANVIGTLMFVIALAIVFAGQVISKRRQTRR
ncbi:MAG TPA: ABC transporter permease, partial [Actinobacteria bacterium]|nr:ABC transporter permease [Actinomycetota bacterium]